MRYAIRNLVILAALGGTYGGVGTAVAADASVPSTAEQRTERQARMKAHWDKLDVNYDGTLSREEVQQGRPKLAEHFAKIDANGDGQLTPQEMREARVVHQARIQAGMKASWEKLDGNHDGKLSRDEVQSKPKLAQNFDKVDANGDGQLTPMEMHEAWRARHENRSL